MRPLHRIFALLTLLGWLFAAGHVLMEHEGVADGGLHQEMPGGEEDHDHDHNAPSQEGEHHHHDLSVMDGGQWIKAGEHKTLAPAWVPLADVLLEQLRAMLREEFKPRLLPTCEHAPPDERAAGWLLVVQTALPVRGPSLVV